MKKVVIDSSYTNGNHHKYIVANVTDNTKGCVITVIRANNKEGWGHSGVFYFLLQEIKNMCGGQSDVEVGENKKIAKVGNFFTVECLGGGTLSTDSESWIFIYGSSTSYGREHDRRQTSLILKEEFPSFTIDFEY